MRRLRHVSKVLLCLASGLALACAGAGKSSEPAVLVTLRDYRGGASYELASESHTDPVEYYSDARTDARRKIQTDEVMSAFLRELDRLGFGDHARVGPAPSVASGGVVRWGIEAEGPSGTAHWLVGTGSSPDDWNAFQQCRDTFLALYNATVSYQTVENPEGREFFEEGKRAVPAQKQGTRP